MVLRSRAERGSMNDAIKESLSKMPDPLHFELPHTHKKLLEVVYALIVIGAIASILVYGTVVGWPSTVVNASVMLVMALTVILAIMLVEKSSIVHRPEKSSS